MNVCIILLVDAQRTYLLKEDHDKLTKEDTGGIFLEHEALQCEDDNEIALELTDGGPLLLESSDEEELYTPRMGFVAVTAGVGHV